MLTKPPIVDPPARAFYATNVSKLFACDPGYVYVTWRDTNGNALPTVTYLIGATPVRTPANLFHTQANLIH